MSTINSSEKDLWDKIGILSKPLGAFATAIVIAYLGYITTDIFDKRQEHQSKIQLYSQLMTSREHSDSDLRKEMFNASLENFLTPQDPEDRVVKLDLLAHNFHASLDLAPLFGHLYEYSESSSSEINARIRKLSRNINDKQLSILSAVGESVDGKVVYISDIPPEGIAVIGDPSSGIAPVFKISEDDVRYFVLEVLLSKDNQTKLRVRLKSGIAPKNEILNDNVSNRYVSTEDVVNDVDQTFEVGIFDFPMMRNIHLPGGTRCAIVIRRLEDVAQVVLVFFPASRSALKEKPYYDEIVDGLVDES